MSLLHKRSSLATRKVSPPQPTCMSDEQKASYLASLRNNRPARPTGSRPLPPKPTGPRQDVNRTVLPRSESDNVAVAPRDVTSNPPAEIPLNHSSSAPTLSRQKGRPLARAPQDQEIILPRKISPPSMTYTESLARQMEKREAHSLRQALEQIDIEDEESRIHSAAQMEAADLVWKHRNPGMAEQEKVAAYRNPDLTNKRYVVGNHRSSSDQPVARVPDYRISGDGSQDLSVRPLTLSKNRHNGAERPVEHIDRLYSSRRRSSGTRKVSSGSGKGAFRNPEDQIYEEETIEVKVIPTGQNNGDLPLQSRSRNSLPRTPSVSLEKPQMNIVPVSKRLNLFEIHRNPPSQSRNAEYASNHTPPRQPSPDEASDTLKSRAMEIRSDEIRAATSMRRKDRSPKLPTPTAVSDKPGRPIVSFDPSWKPVAASSKSSLDLDREKPMIRPMPSIPVISVSAPAIPTITLAETPDMTPVSNSRSIPIINLPDDDDNSSISNIEAQNSPPIPTIEVQCDTDDIPISIPTIAVSEATAPKRPLPVIQSQTPNPRPLPHHARSAPSANTARSSGSRLPWLSRRPDSSGSVNGRSPTVTCTACDLPISGRIVTASGSSNSTAKARFHPECFNCFHCNTALECVSFYPEPESAMLERLKAQNKDSEYQDGDIEVAPPTASDLRFYCHLDFHELFSPKCASCHTPIEGSIIMAAGKAWHEGHFFCAECGDPFSSSSPFVEAKGYAYCVTCHTKRTASRCRGCKNQILDEISVEALGGKWHGSCFVCFECEFDFGPEGRFFVREIEIDLTEKEKRKGADYRKIEERAVCQRCEERRLKSWNVRSPAGGSSVFV